MGYVPPGLKLAPMKLADLLSVVLVIGAVVGIAVMFAMFLWSLAF